MNGEQFEKIKRRESISDQDAARSNSGKAKREWHSIPLHKKHAAVSPGKHKRVRAKKVPKHLRRLLDEGNA